MGGAGFRLQLCRNKTCENTRGRLDWPCAWVGLKGRRAWARPPYGVNQRGEDQFYQMKYSERTRIQSNMIKNQKLKMNVEPDTFG